MFSRGAMVRDKNPPNMCQSHVYLINGNIGYKNYEKIQLPGKLSHKSLSGHCAQKKKQKHREKWRHSPNRFTTWFELKANPKIIHNLIAPCKKWATYIYSYCGDSAKLKLTWLPRGSPRKEKDRENGRNCFISGHWQLPSPWISLR